MKLKKRENQIFNKLSEILLKGKGFKNEYIKYLESILLNGEYDKLCIIYEKYLNIDITKMSIPELYSDNMLSKFKLYLNSDELNIIKRILDKNNMYIVSNSIYSVEDNSIIFTYDDNGEIINFYLNNNIYTFNKSEHKIVYIWNSIISMI